ncbi:MAG: transcription termination factor Rho [Patescibacteria group bacterium]
MSSLKSAPESSKNPSLDVEALLESLDVKPITPISDSINQNQESPKQEVSGTSISQDKNTFETPQDSRKNNAPAQQSNLEEDLKVSYEAKGILEITSSGYGFLRREYEINPASDIYISPSQIKRFWLRKGDLVEGLARAPKNGERYHSLLLVQKINGKAMTEAESQARPQFDNLTSLHPNKQIKLEYKQDVMTSRIIDLIAPIGFGQRALIVSQPKAGKTTFLKDIAQGVTANYPEVHLVAILIGERPEEVTEIKRFIQGEVAASHFDQSPRQQVKVANLALDRARRLVEMGKDVVILLDSITRLARAYNLAGPTDENGNFMDQNARRDRYGRNRGGYRRYNDNGMGGNDFSRGGRGSMSGGMDQSAMFPAKKFLGAARNCEEGGSLTIIGTALVGTESRMDDLIYEEFKGTGNMEIHLDRKLAEKRIFPAVDIQLSGTRKEELLYDETTYKRIVTLRRMLALLTPEEAITNLIEKLSKSKENKDFLDQLGNK